jgi:hypothetical protein
MTKAMIFLLILGSMISCSKVAEEASKAVGGNSNYYSASNDSCTSSSSAFPMCFSVGSLTASSSTSLALKEKNRNISALSIKAEDEEVVYTTNAEMTDNQVMNTIAAVVIASEESEEASSCPIVELPSLTETLPGPSCYGPELTWTDHPECSTPMSCGTGAPTGDLGIWENNSTKGLACSAVKLNTDMVNIRLKVDAIMLIMASIKCVAVDLPAVGETKTLTTSLGTYMTGGSKTLTFTEATFKRLDDGSGNALYQYHIEGSLGGTSLEINIKHSDLAIDGSTFEGNLFARFEGGITGSNCNDTRGGGDLSTTCDSIGITLDYKKETGNLASYHLVSAEYLESDKTEIFDTNARIEPQGRWGANFTQVVASIDQDDFTGSASYAWVAGGGFNDASGKKLEDSRAFNIYITGSTGSRSGASFYGYGDPVGGTDGTDSHSDEYGIGIINKFYCDWVVEKTAKSDYAQKQLIEENSSGALVVSAGGNFTKYAPTSDCNLTQTQIDGGFVYTQPNSDTGAFSHELVSDLPDDTHYKDSYTAPVRPDLSFAPAE